MSFIFLMFNLTTLISYIDIMNNGNVTLSPTAYDTCSLSHKLEEKNYAKTMVVLKKCELMEAKRREGSLNCVCARKLLFKLNM